MLYLRQLAQLAADGQTLGDRLVEIVERRVEASLATNLERVNARVAARQARRQYRLAEANYQTALLALVQQLGLPPDARLNLTGDLTQFNWLSVGDAYCLVAEGGAVEPERLAAELAEARPDVMAARSGAAIARANADLALRGPHPGCAGRPDLRNRRRRHALSGSAAACAISASSTTARLCRTSGKWKCGSSSCGTSSFAVGRPTKPPPRSTATNGPAATSPKPPPKAARPRAELDEIVAQFEAGRADVVNVLAIQNNLLQDLRAYLDLVNEVAQAAAQVTQTTGLPPERLIAPPRPELLPPVAPADPQ